LGKIHRNNNSRIINFHNHASAELNFRPDLGEDPNASELQVTKLVSPRDFIGRRSRLSKFNHTSKHRLHLVLWQLYWGNRSHLNKINLASSSGAFHGNTP
jgi:hypothetical protein